MKDKKNNKKDFLHRIQEFPEVKTSLDFLERVHKKIEEIENENTVKNITYKKRTLSERLKEFWGNYGKSYLVPAFGVLLLVLIMYYLFSGRQKEGSEEIITGKNGIEKHIPVILSENEMKLLDSLLKDQKKILDNSTKDIEKTVQQFAEHNGKNFNKIFARLYGTDSLKIDTVNSIDVNKAGTGSELDKELKIKIEELDGKSLEKVVNELGLRIKN